MSRFGAGRSARRGLRVHEHDAPLPGLRCPDGRSARAIETHLFEQATELFGLRHTVTLYDLTNTFYEGSALGPSQGPDAATPGRSAAIARYSPWGWYSTARASCAVPKCSRAPSAKLQSLGRHASTPCMRPPTLCRGDGRRRIATVRQHHLAQGRRLPLSGRSAGNATATSIPTWRSPSRPVSRQKVHVHKVIDKDDSEARLYCYSEARAKKEHRTSRDHFATSLRGPAAEAQRRAGATAHPQAARPCLATDRPVSREEPRRRCPLRHRGASPTTAARRPGPSPGSARCAAGVHDHTSRRLLPAHQHGRLGRGSALAHLHRAHRCGSRLSITQVRARPAPHLP